MVNSNDLKELDRLKRASIPECDQKLLDSASMGSVFGVKEALDNGADVNARDEKGYSALSLATVQRKGERYSRRLARKEAVELLIQNGADVVSIFNGGESIGIIFQEKPELFNPTASLLIASHSGNLEKIKEAIENGADVNTMKGGLSALMFISRNENETRLLKPVFGDWNNLRKETIKLLIKNGADVNAKTEFGSTALSLAVINNDNTEIVELLIKNGADVNIKDVYTDSTPLSDATQLNHIGMIKLLIENGADIVHALLKVYEGKLLEDIADWEDVPHKVSGKKPEASLPEKQKVLTILREFTKEKIISPEQAHLVMNGLMEKVNKKRGNLQEPNLKRPKEKPNGNEVKKLIR